ncbi:hypothetical protein [Sodalinema gerasimenkoae]|uniref:hypothetical protein n=1 Tax=Sodalinema gerasimenkoae TaxID=2862348 RepID=UPI001FE9465A|nr:hypothetical protein [Sodalinema gerasimenkoae]
MRIYAITISLDKNHFPGLVRGDDEGNSLLIKNISEIGRVNAVEGKIGVLP